jgi:hypothetical protein
MRGLFVAALSFAATAAAALGGVAGGARLETLYATASGGIAGFAQDGPLIAWFQTSTRGCNSIHIRQLENGLNAALPTQTARNVTCTWQVASTPVQLAIDLNSDVIWTLHERVPLAYDYLLGAGALPGNRRERRFQQLAHTAHGAGLWLGDIVAEGNTLAYAVTSVDYEDEAGCLAGSAPCSMKISTGGSGVYRIVNWQPQLVPRTKAAVEVAASNGVLAIVETGTLTKAGRPAPAADLPIDVVDAQSGDPIASVQPQGTPLAVGLAPHVLATLELTPLGTRIAWYDPQTGHPVGSIPVSASTAHELAVSDRYIVFHVDRSIREVDISTGRVRTLTTAAATPIGLSLAGMRLAWAENLKHGARIRALQLPR